MNPPHITEGQREGYFRYLADLYTYLGAYIYAGQHTHYSEYEATIASYRLTTNPEGAKIYDKQEAYYEKLTTGTNTQKTASRPVAKPQTEKAFEKKEEQEPIRKDDPKIDLEVLQNTKWDPVKYPNAAELKKPNVNMIFIGHVDAGKSTLSGRLMKNLKLVDEQ